jgi:hypothetical protein
LPQRYDNPSYSLTIVAVASPGENGVPSFSSAVSVSRTTTVRQGKIGRYGAKLRRTDGQVLQVRQTFTDTGCERSEARDRFRNIKPLRKKFCETAATYCIVGCNSCKPDMNKSLLN